MRGGDKLTHSHPFRPLAQAPPAQNPHGGRKGPISQSPPIVEGAGGVMAQNVSISRDQFVTHTQMNMRESIFIFFLFVCVMRRMYGWCDTQVCGCE